MGAIGHKTDKVESALAEFSKDKHAEVAETCQLALARLEWLEKQKTNESKGLSANPYYSVDPAPPHLNRDVDFLRRKLVDESESMFERYRAMFQLRNDGSDQAILALCDGRTDYVAGPSFRQLTLKFDLNKTQGLKAKSALFRHEIAYVLGQIQSPLSIDALRANLEDESENHMVRHECAEALGSLATDECVSILNKYLHDKEAVVKESCEVALDITDYEKSNEFQYANGLSTNEILSK